MTKESSGWLMDRPAVTSVILGARTVDQLEQNLIAATLDLSDDERDALTTVSAPGMAIYPFGFMERYGEVSVWEELGTRSTPPPIGA